MTSNPSISIYKQKENKLKTMRFTSTVFAAGLLGLAYYPAEALRLADLDSLST